MKIIVYKLFPRTAQKIRRIKRKFIISIHRKYTISEMRDYISKKYLKYVGYPMDWEEPKSYTQKIQYSKLYNKQSLRTSLSDKVSVRDFIKNTIGEKYLIPIYGVWETFEEINFDELPNQFVLKTNHGSATNIIIRDKSKMNYKKIKKQMTDFIKDDFAYYGFELQYSGIKPLIYAEKLLEFDDSGIEDYKFLCFDGKVDYFWIDFNRYSNHKRNMYDLNWNLMPWNQWTYDNYKEKVNKPSNFDEMVECALALCRGFDQVRVDLYNVNGNIYFGELTFTNGGGYEVIIPQEMDFELGSKWKIDI